MKDKRLQVDMISSIVLREDFIQRTKFQSSIKSHYKTLILKLWEDEDFMEYPKVRKHNIFFNFSLV